MSKRGPKARNASNARPKHPGGIDWSKVSAPEGLSDGAAREWARLVRLLRSMGSLERTDPMAVEALAVNVDLLRRCREAVDLEGLVVPIGDDGRVMAHPLLQVVNQATLRLRGLLADLGLTPASNRHAGKASGGGSDDNKWGGLLSLWPSEREGS